MSPRLCCRGDRRARSECRVFEGRRRCEDAVLREGQNSYDTGGRLNV